MSEGRSRILPRLWGQDGTSLCVDPLSGLRETVRDSTMQNELKTFRAAVECLLVLPLAAAGDALAQQPTSTSKPNILVVLTDDLGFSDLGCYGSEIATPNLDRLASNGLRFTQFYNTAKCHSTRVSLLSGRWCRQAGDVALTRAAILPEVLGSSGYFTLMTGKWHLEKQPTDFGFQRYFGHLSGATPYYLGNNTFRLNGQSWTVPSEGFYTTVANVDFALRFLREAREAKKPWFLYLAFNAPHAPLQPLEADYKKYLGRYDAGWDVIRATRVAKQKQLGLFGKNVEPCPRPEHIPSWDSLTPELRRWEARRMAAYAGLIDRVDQELGRLLADLQAKGELDNTLFLFLSDNGACPYDRRTIGRDGEPFDPDSAWSDSTGWAWMRNTPFRYYKQNQFEGGIATPAIVHWPAGLKTTPGKLVDCPAHVVDVLPTLTEITNTTLPTSWPGRDLSPLSGISLAPVFAARQVESRPPIHLLFSSDRGLRDGDWKLVSFQSEPWELYNLAQDRTELHNVAAEHPEIVERMAKLWFAMAENDMRAPAKDRDPVASKATTPHRHSQWTDYASVNASSVRHDVAKAANQRRKTALRSGKLTSNGQGIRARAATKLAIEDGQLVLQCEGNDSGLAFDQLPGLPAGPYTLELRVQSRADGEGEIYWTTDADTRLPRGGHQTFSVPHDGQWHSIVLSIPETKPLFALRLDPCSGRGEARIDNLTLKDARGVALKSWP